jgi:(p)ppGpp synthase/HD superfamily hydrolase
MDRFKEKSAESFRELARRFFADADADMVLSAHDLVVERLDGDSSLVRAADVLLRQQADQIVVTAALLVPLRRCACIEPDEMRSRFGDAPTHLVENVFRENTAYTDTEAHRKEDVRRFLESISGDLRAVILQIGLRLAELERLGDQADDDHPDIARDTMDLYVPLADRMGMAMLRTQLEDACFQILEPAVYAELARSAEPLQAEDNICLELLKDEIRNLLERNGVNGTVQSRTKGLYSLYHKMCRRKCSLQDVMDMMGLRIIVSSVEECYKVLGLLHTHFRPIRGTFQDYIGSPKKNGYQSLHTSVYPVPDICQKPVEIQIRTETMHREAEFGIAAHWRYKGEDDMNLDAERQLQWVHSLLLRHEQAVRHAEFIEHLRRQVYDDQLVVFDKTGQKIWLPADGTVRDFAERVGRSNQPGLVARVNGVAQPMSCPLRDEDTVELIHINEA